MKIMYTCACMIQVCKAPPNPPVVVDVGGV